MRNSVSWLPAPRSWVNAIALLLIFFCLQYALEPLIMLLQWIAPFWPNVWSLLYLLVLIGPVLIITFLHHWFHKTLDQFVPDTRVVEIDGQSTAFPNIFSWWQGLYGLFVSTFAYILSLAIISLVFSFGDITTIIKTQLANPAPIIISPIVIGQFILRLIISAYLYHVEFSVQQQLIASNR